MRMYTMLRTEAHSNIELDGLPSVRDVWPPVLAASLDQFNASPLRVVDNFRSHPQSPVGQ